MTVGGVLMQMVLETACIPEANLRQIKAFSKCYWVTVVIRMEALLKYATHSPLWQRLDQQKSVSVIYIKS